MRPRPAIVLAHYEGIQFVADDDLDRLDEIGRLAERSPVGRWDSARAIELLGSAQVILGHWGCPPIDGRVLDLAPELGLIAYAAGTVKGVVDPVVFDRGIRVTSCADANAAPVAEFTLAAILFANKAVAWRRDLLRDPSIASGIAPSELTIGNWGKTIGIVGASLVGRRVIELLGPFDHLHVLVYDPYLDDAEATRLGTTKVDLAELCRRSDVVSIHAPDLPSTRHLLGAAELAAMRTGATLINTARGALVDHAALTDELRSGRLFAYLDVTDPEPLPSDHVLRHLPNVFLTPHLAGSEGTELARLSAGAIDEVERWIEGRPARHEIRAGDLDRIA